jgi:uncharacterized membrane protein
MLKIVIAIFRSRETVLQAIDRLAEVELVDIHKVAVVSKAANGETTLVDNELRPIEAFRAGMGVGALMTALGVAQLGAFSLPGIGPIVAIGAGALFGGLIGGATGQFAAVLMGFGFDSTQVDRLAEHLNSDEVALLIQTDNVDKLPQLRAELDNLDAQIIEASEFLEQRAGTPSDKT